MAIYAKRDGNNLIVAAADSLVELEAFAATATAKENINARQPSPGEMLMDDRFSNFKTPPWLFEMEQKSDQDNFISEFNISVVGPNKLVDRHGEMLEKLEQDPYFMASEDEDDPERLKRTIGELHGINNDDPWDNRSEKDKEKDEEYKKKYEAAKKAGKLSGDDSFAPPGAKVTDVRTTVHSDGKVTIDRVLAVKGLYDTSREERAKAEKRVSGGGSQKASGRSIEEIAAGILDPDSARAMPQPEPENPMEEILHDLMSAPEPLIDDNGVELAIAPNDDIPLFFKVDVLGASIADVQSKLGADDVWSTIFEMRDTGSNCWFAFSRHKQGLAFEERAAQEGFVIEEHPYGVKPDGDRLVDKGAKGVVVVDTEEKREIGPRPWNERADEYEKMSDEEKKEEWKNVKGDEFIFSGSYQGAAIGTVVYITPRSYFEEHGAMYDKPLDIDHLIDRDVKEIQPGGIYKSTSRDWNSLNNSLSSKGMTENWAFQLYLNTL